MNSSRVCIQSFASTSAEVRFSIFDSYNAHTHALLQCSDLILNTPENLLGHIPKELKLSPFGLTLLPMGWPSSYTTPMALVAWIKAHQDQSSEAEMLDYFLDGNALRVDLRAAK
ncbi:MAG: hypothetical protein HRU09_18870 [Oligoflexales bacterium]|nr:hypothetical protein [Oligoflexales bacterium]